ncbi:translation initiation factor IF-2 [Candidatus Saccharibacteria bacterium]|nr:MAG: translation initiation factor IF-2 [Candidatus Saccharibacteria bacterium]PID98840.1 MAG: translation initiation factor IF-2 [Candidatus Saccharibacteria bacterium]
MAATIQVPDSITVGELAEVLQLSATRLIGELFKNGIVATINERLDFDTAQIIVGELGLDVELTRKTTETEFQPRKKPVLSEKSINRPPVVAVMGHVDHGKTSLLDAIRGAQVAHGEAGGITQHISAYQIEHNKRAITFLDTPGHEAFAAIRQHGADLTDIVIIVVAADDGVKPQTIEAIRYAKNAGTKIVVAINKMDKEGANPGLVMGQLAEQGVVADDKAWGGDVPMVEVSAKSGDGLPALLDTILLVADINELKADPTVPARGLIIEAHVEHGRGPIAHALVEEGILRAGQFIVAGGAYAKVRSLESTDGKAITSAGASCPVVISGFKSLPEFGDQFAVVARERDAREQAAATAAERAQGANRSDMSGSELLRIMSRSDKLQELPVIIKADVQGSLTSVADSLKSIGTDEVAVRVASSGVGAVNDNDVHLARSAGATIYGFNTTVANNIKRLANRDKVSIRLYSVIYELLDDAKRELSKLLAPEVTEREIGTLEVKGVFKTTKTEVICGGEVQSGKLTVPASVRVKRGKEQIGAAELKGLKRGPNPANDLVEGELGGLDLETTSRLELQLGDMLEFYVVETKERAL